MPQTNRPTEGKFQTALLGLWARAKKLLPSKQDPVTAAVAIPAGIVLLVLHGKGVDVVPMAAALALALIAPTATWLGGKYRVAAVTVACFLLAAIVASTWRQGGYWAAIPLALVVWVPWSIGRTRRKPAKHAAALVKQGLAMVSEGLALASAAEFPESGVKVGKAKLGRSGTAVVADGHISTSNGRGNGSIAKGAENTVASRLANRLTLPTPALVGTDLSATKAAGSFELVMPLAQEFDYEPQTMPPVEQWPDNQFPLATDAIKRVIWLSITTIDHVLISGRTRWGKSNSLWVILTGIVRATGGAAEFRVIDPKGGAEFGAWRRICADFACTPDEGRQLLARLVTTMDERYRIMQSKGQRKSDLWPIFCVIDEAAQVLDDKASRALSLKLAQMALAANIHLVYATQYPTDDLFGSALKQNISTVITHRLKDSIGSNVAMGAGAKGDGWDASKLEKPGRAIIELPHLVEARIKGQVYYAPDEIPEDVARYYPEPPSPGRPPTTGGSPHAGHSAPESPESGPGIHPDRTGPEMPDAWALLTDHVATRTPKERIVDGLDDDPMTITEVMARSGLGKSRAYQVMKELCTEGHALPVKGGWVRA